MSNIRASVNPVGMLSLLLGGRGMETEEAGLTTATLRATRQPCWGFGIVGERFLFRDIKLAWGRCTRRRGRARVAFPFRRRQTR